MTKDEKYFKEIIEKINIPHDKRIERPRTDKETNIKLYKYYFSNEIFNKKIKEAFLNLESKAFHKQAKSFIEAIFKDCLQPEPKDLRLSSLVNVCEFVKFYFIAKGIKPKIGYFYPHRIIFQFEKYHSDELDIEVEF